MLGYILKDGLRFKNLFEVICKAVVKFHVFLLILSPVAKRR